MWCKHKYEKASITFSPPPPFKSVKTWGEGQNETTKYILYGCSTITQICVKCDKAHSYTVAGDARDAVQ